MNNKAMYQLTYGLFVLTASEDGKDSGCIINTAGQVTSTPNRISIAVNKANHTHDMIMNTRKFTVSVLSEKAPFALFQRFGFQSGRDVNKFEGFDAWKRGFNDVPYITEGTTWAPADLFEVLVGFDVSVADGVVTIAPQA